MTSQEITEIYLSTRNLKDWEIKALIGTCNEVIASYIELKYLTSLRSHTLLQLTLDNIEGNTLEIHVDKTNESRNDEHSFILTGELKKVMDKIINLPRVSDSRYLFCHSNGAPYTCRHLLKLWPKLMRKALKETDLVTQFTENDIRVKKLTDDHRKFLSERRERDNQSL